MIEYVPVDDEALNGAFAYELGFERGGMMWALTPAGRKALSDETIERKGAPPSSTQNIERNGCNKTGETT